MSGTPAWAGLRDDLEALHSAALEAADPAAAVGRSLRVAGDRLFVGDRSFPLEPAARAWVVGLGKAACRMTRAAISALGPRLAGGVVAHPHEIAPGADWPAGILPIAAGHPLPDEGSIRAGDAALELLRRIHPPDLVVVLVSGGGSALLEVPRPGVTLAELRSVTEALQRGGADIVELNTVRGALSRIKGGGLGRAAGPARVVTLLLSDVVGDRVGAIASGPTVDSPSGLAEALVVLERRGLANRFAGLTKSIHEAVEERGSMARVGERIECVVGSNRIAGMALGARAQALGFRTLHLTDRMQGEAREVGRCLGGIARGIRERNLPYSPPACLVLGGETTVTVLGRGRGGRNLELALGAALELDGCPRVAVFSFATDGLDGSSGAAGAVATGETVSRARAAGLSPHAALAENDTAPFFDALADLWKTGPSGTNVNDLTVLIAYP